MSEELCYRGMIYDPKIKYLGPEGNAMSSLIPKTPPGLDCVFEEWNVASFYHDGDYKGKRLKGFFGRIKDWFIRSRADGNFFNRLANALDRALQDGEINKEGYEFGIKYAKLCHTAVRYGGVLFYRTDK